MNNNLETLIRAIVPLSFMAIWALTSLFNREAKATQASARTGPSATPRPRPAGGDPTVRFASRPAIVAGTSTTAGRRGDRRDDEIVILSSSTMTPNRNSRQVAGTSRRPARGKPALPDRQPDPAPSRARLAGVSQNVNQQLTHSTMDVTPLAPIAALPALGLGAASTAAASTAVNFRSTAASNLADPIRLREAFVLNEILQPPVSRRGRAGR